MFFRQLNSNIFTKYVIIVVIVSGIVYGINLAFFDIQRINGQEYLTESTSSHGTYTLTFENMKDNKLLLELEEKYKWNVI